jgi:hypothetical protein
MPSAQWGVFEWGDAEWGVAEAEAPGTRTPTAATLSLTGYAPSVSLSNLQKVPLVGALVFTGAPPAPGETRPLVATLTLTGTVSTVEVSGENMLGFTWPVRHPADIVLGFQWTVLPQVITGATLELTWIVIGAPPPLGFTWQVLPEEIFELFESAGVGAAAGIGEDILLPVGRVTRA